MIDVFKNPARALQNEPATFMVCRDRITGKEVKIIWRRPCAALDEMREQVSRCFRNLDLIECRPYDRVEDAHRPLWPVPIQNTLIDPPTAVELPKPARFGVLIRPGQPLTTK